ncbi:MAG: extracellular solute-binding protein [Clostridia bacterium]|nr:extracellular solute-binding protein [Clostridia bacterium]
MSKTIKKIVALMLVLLLALSVAACGGNGGTGTGNNGGTQGGASAENALDSAALIASVPAELKGTTVRFLNWYDPYDFGQEGQVIDRFKQESGINVEIIDAQYGDAYNEKLASMVATGDSPDVYTSYTPSFNAMKFSQPISVTGYDFSDPAWSKSTADLYSVNGTPYAFGLSYTPFKRFNIIIYNSSSMDEMGFDDPWELYKKGEWTWEKLEEMSAEWVKQGTDFYGMQTVIYNMVAETVGKDFVTYDGSKYSLNLYDADLLDAWKFLLEGRDNRIFTQGTGVFDSMKPTTLFAIGNTHSLETANATMKIQKYGTFKAVPMPKFEGKDFYTPVNETIGFSVATGAKNPAAVPYFVGYFANLANYEPHTYYYDEQSHDVMMTLLATDNQYQSISRDIFVFESHPFHWNLFSNGTAAQITTFIQSMENQAAAKMEELNQVLATK